MDPNSSSDIDLVRRTAVSRRGGVRVRGGRLPPIRMRDSLLSSTNKKVVAPNIPQRRVRVKQEPDHGEVSSGDNRRDCDASDSRQKSSRGRGRGRAAKVYLQTEGTFLAEGPAMKIKKELPVIHYERLPRGSSKDGCRIKSEDDMKFDASRLRELLENYDDNEAYLDYENPLQPVRLPLVKRELKLEIKKEIIENDDVKPIIKEELMETNDVKPVIKEEPDETDDVKPVVKEESNEIGESQWGSKVLHRIKTEDKSQAERSDVLDDIKFLKDEDVLILLQLPKCLPFKKPTENLTQPTSSDKSSKTQEKTSEESEIEVPTPSLRDMSEGHMGKLQILKSGEMRLIVGPVKMAVETATASETVCEVASIPFENKGESDIVIIGKIDQKMILRPLLNHMMKEGESEEDICSKTDKMFL